MLLCRKKSFVLEWWIAKKDDKFKFINITDARNVTTDCIVIGRNINPINHYITSVHHVEKVTKKGVYTASGRYYPFKNAHPLYLKFLCEIILKSSIIASRWERIDIEDNIYIADIEYPNGEIVKDVVFDFKSDVTNFKGVSNVLGNTVVFNTFDRREFSGDGIIKDYFPCEISNFAFDLADEKPELVKGINKIFKRNKN